MRAVSIAIAILLGLAAGTVGWLGVKWPPASAPDAAAWAQAITSAAAVVVALSVVFWQNGFEERRRRVAARSARIARLESIYQLACYVETVANKLVSETRGIPSPNPFVIESGHAECVAAGAALSKYIPEHFTTYDELEPFIRATAVQKAVEHYTQQASSLCRTNAMGNWLNGELSLLLPELKSASESLAFVVRTANDKKD